MESQYDMLSGEDVILSDKKENEPSQKWEEVKADGDWVMLKHPRGKLFLHVSEDGEKLTKEEHSKGLLHFI